MWSVGIWRGVRRAVQSLVFAEASWYLLFNHGWPRRATENHNGRGGAERREVNCTTTTEATEATDCSEPWRPSSRRLRSWATVMVFALSSRRCPWAPLRAPIALSPLLSILPLTFPWPSVAIRGSLAVAVEVSVRFRGFRGRIAVASPWSIRPADDLISPCPDADERDRRLDQGLDSIEVRPGRPW